MVAPPGTPPERTQTLRAVFRQAVESRELLAEAEKLQLPMEPAYGEDVARMIRTALGQDADTVKMIDALINAK